MTNPCGPYPGRQLFLGLTADGKPCLVYLVSGRSPESRQRQAVQVENTVRIGPLGDTPYDPLRHYNALKYDNGGSGVAVVSNGVQTEAVFETYRLLVNVGTAATGDFMAKILDGADAEPDSLHTPRIAGAVIPGQDNPVLIVGIKTYGAPAGSHQIKPVAGKLCGVATYKGDLENPAAPDPAAAPVELEFNGGSAQELAQFLYDLSEASYRGDDIRVCAIGGVYSGGTWDIAIINRHQA